MKPGDAIYLVCCRLMTEHSDTVESIHATFDGTNERFEGIKNHFRKQEGFRVDGETLNSFYVHGPNGLHRMYYVATRTLED